MKRVLTFLLSVLLLTGCQGQNQELERMMTFRASLLSGMGCTFQAIVTADYQEEVYQFTLDCRCDEQGTVSFTVVEPDTIAGISGEISAEGGKLTFENEKALAFETLADGQVTPVTAPWLLMKTLRGGYVTSCGIEDRLMRVSIDDSYRDDALRLDIWFDNNNVPNHAEILWANRRILSLEITSFEIL